MNRKNGQRESHEQSIVCVKAALQFLTFDASPLQRALVQVQLGSAHNASVTEEKHMNQEKAIGYCNATLTVLKRDEFPEQWAAVQYLLGEIYRNRLAGECKVNLEHALECCQQALQVLTREVFLIEWALTQVLAGLIYVELGAVVSEPVEMYERALECYVQAEPIFTEEIFPLQWAMIQQGLSFTYAMRSRGNKSANLQQAITRGQSSLRVLTRARYPFEWAGTHTYLAEAYRQATASADLCELYSGRSIMQEQALRHLDAALQIYTVQSYPLEWAKAQCFLGMIYMERVIGKRSENLEQARESFEAVLQVFPRESSPCDWASTQALLNTVSLTLEEA